jgi:phosphate/sulfate permease
MDQQTASLALVVLIIVVALAFDYVNGFHDAANSIATVVATRVLSPGVAVAWAAFFNFIAFLVFGTAVAKTIGGDMVNIAVIPAGDQLYVLLAGVLGAILWNLITWYLGLPTSSSHALVGGYAGSAIASYIWHFGWNSPQVVLKAEGWIKTLSFIVLSPLIGMTIGFLLMVTVYWIFHRVSVNRVDRVFRIWPGDAIRGLAHRQDDGHKDRKASTGRRILCRDCRFDHAVRGDVLWHSSLDHTHHYRLDRRRRLGKAFLGREMGRRGPHCMGLDIDHPDGRPDRGALLRRHSGYRKDRRYLDLC